MVSQENRPIKRVWNISTNRYKTFQVLKTGGFSSSLEVGTLFILEEICKQLNSNRPRNVFAK
jgi:hypothetical protein